MTISLIIFYISLLMLFYNNFSFLNWYFNSRILFDYCNILIIFLLVVNSVNIYFNNPGFL